MYLNKYCSLLLGNFVSFIKKLNIFVSNLITSVINKLVTEIVTEQQLLVFSLSPYIQDFLSMFCPQMYHISYQDGA